jgi:E3 ubiquitin-protein ligase RNFT1
VEEKKKKMDLIRRRLQELEEIVRQRSIEREQSDQGYFDDIRLSSSTTASAAPPSRQRGGIAQQEQDGHMHHVNQHHFINLEDTDSDHDSNNMMIDGGRGLGIDVELDSDHDDDVNVLLSTVNGRRQDEEEGGDGGDVDDDDDDDVEDQEYDYIAMSPLTESDLEVGDLDVSVAAAGIAASMNQGQTALNSMFGSLVELDGMGKWFEQAAPFALLVLILWLYEHRIGLLVGGWLVVVLQQAEKLARDEAAKKSGVRLKGMLLAVMATLVAHVCVVYAMFSSDGLTYSLLLWLPGNAKAATTFMGALWVVVVNGLMVRYGTLAFKCAALLLGARASGKPRGIVDALSAIEMASHIYLLALPVPVWFAYFTSGERGASVVGLLLCGVYVTWKFSRDIVPAVKRFFASVSSLAFDTLPFGAYATRDDLDKAGVDMCAICQETNIDEPVKLQCGNDHIFCEQCISVWFERETTCPLCRATVPGAGARHNLSRYSPLSQSSLLFVW